MNKYISLNNQKFVLNNYSIVPIRFEDRYLIMKWRNEQIYHLRQNELLTIESQDLYFKTVVNKLYLEKYPTQILFSYLENDICVGYGGLVHINWKDRNAEISFIMKTELENKSFQDHWHIFLHLIENVAFSDLKLHKIYTYAFDLRPRLFEVLKKNKYKQEANLVEHIFFENKFINVLIHSKINERFNF